MYTSENHFNTKASDCAIEEVYTNLDIGKDCEYNPKTGYAFYYPYRFVNDPAQLKAVGIRRLDIQPSGHTIHYTIIITPIYKDVQEETTKTEETTTTDRATTDDDGTYKYSNTIEVTSLNNLIEIIDKMCDDIYSGMTIKYGEKYKHKLLYNYSNNELSFFVNDENNKIYGTLNITASNSFLEFLNQTTDNPLTDTTQQEIYKFSNVWDRNYIEFHASFSDSNRNFIGRNNTFYTRPSLFYLIPTNTPGFNIWFTSNGISPILPRYCKFTIQLCFVLNYKMFRI